MGLVSSSVMIMVLVVRKALLILIVMWRNGNDHYNG